MNDAKLMQIFDSKSDLVGQVLDSLLRQGEASLLNVIEEVLALHELENNKVGLTVLK